MSSHDGKRFLHDDFDESGSNEKRPEDNGELDQRAIRFSQMFAKNEEYLRMYLFSLIPNRDDASEVLQQASMVIWRKLDALNDDKDFLKWAYRVVRFEALAFRRKKARSRMYFDSDLLDKISLDYEADEELMRARGEAVVFCLSSLSSADQQIAKHVFNDRKKILDVAKIMGKEKSAFYKIVKKIRSRLIRCVENRVKGESI